jgi:hypothetical protein
MNNFFSKRFCSDGASSKKRKIDAFSFPIEDKSQDSRLLDTQIDPSSKHSLADGVIPTEIGSDNATGFDNLDLEDSQGEETIVINSSQLKSMGKSESSDESSKLVSNVLSSPRIRSNLKPSEPLVLSEKGSSHRSPQEGYNLIISPHSSSRTGLPLTEDIVLTNKLLLSTFLQVEEEAFDPLFLSLPGAMKNEIAERQKLISSDWPLLTIPSIIRSSEDKDLHEMSIVQAQISNASQMVIKMLLNGNAPAALQYSMDIYALSTRAATSLNNRRTELIIPNTKVLLDLEQSEVIRPAAKNVLSSYKSLSTIQSFFRGGGGVPSFSPPRFQVQSQTSGVGFSTPQAQIFDPYRQQQNASFQDSQSVDLLQQVQTLLGSVQQLLPTAPQRNQYYGPRRGSKRFFNYRGKRASEYKKGPFQKK